MDYRTHPFNCELEQELHMALSLIREEGLVKIFRYLGRQREGSGLVDLVNAELNRGTPLGDIFSETGPIETRSVDNFCIFSFRWVSERRGWVTFGTQGDVGCISQWAVDFDEAGEVCGSELHAVNRNGEEVMSA
jgi:hypothetical protein